MSDTSTYYDNNKTKQLAHELVAELFSGAELDDLCAVYFSDVFALFTPEMARVTKIKILVEACAARKGGMSKLINTIKQLKTTDYEHFAANAEKETRPTAKPKADNLLDQTLARRYRMDRVLDKGGVGTVYKAHDTWLQMNVAVKIIDLNRVKLPAVRERVRQEVRTAMQLDHPGIVKVYDFGQSDSLLYIVMEFITGQNLQEARHFFDNLDKKTALPQVLKLARQLCLTVDYMHRQRVLHPGTKPENIMLKNNQGDTDIPWQPVFINLGLLRPHREAIMSGDEISVRRLTYSVSPELLLGHATDIRSDIYTLGVLLYCITTGQPPFRPKNINEAMRLHTNAPPIPPRSITPHLPETVEHVILKALAKDPADRFLTARDMARALTDCLEHPTLSPAAAGDHLIMVTDNNPLDVEPGHPVTIPINLRNRDDHDSHCRITTEGIPREWVSITPAVTTLAPGEEQDILLTIRPPRMPQTQAQPYALTIQATGVNSAKPLSQMQTVLTIGRYREFRSSLWPQEISAGQTTQITIENLGNTEETFIIRPKQSQDLTFNPAEAHIKLNTGESHTTDFKVTPHHPWLNPATNHTFSFMVGPRQEKPRIHSGTVSGKGPKTPVWLISLIALVLCLAAIAFFAYVFDPNTPQAAAEGTRIQHEIKLTQTRVRQNEIAATTTAQTISAQESANQAATATAEWLTQDSDGDNLTNADELTHHTTPTALDSDGDTLPDGIEVYELGTNPTLPDSDFDGIRDDEEVRNILNPTQRDTDLDGTPDSRDAEPGAAAFNPPTATITPTPVTVSFNARPTFLALLTGQRPRYEIDEDRGRAIIEVVLSAPTDRQIQVDYATGISDALPGQDYYTASGTLVFHPGQDRATFTVEIIPDSEDEPDETILLMLKNASPGLEIATRDAELVIADND